MFSKAGVVCQGRLGLCKWHFNRQAAGCLRLRLSLVAGQDEVG